MRSMLPPRPMPLNLWRLQSKRIPRLWNVVAYPPGTVCFSRTKTFLSRWRSAIWAPKANAVIPEPTQMESQTVDDSSISVILVQGAGESKAVTQERHSNTESGEYNHVSQKAKSSRPSAGMRNLDCRRYRGHAGYRELRIDQAHLAEPLEDLAEPLAVHAEVVGRAAQGVDGRHIGRRESEVERQLRHDLLIEREL